MHDIFSIFSTYFQHIPWKPGFIWPRESGIANPRSNIFNTFLKWFSANLGLLYLKSIIEIWVYCVWCSFWEDLFCQLLEIPKTAADITETSLEVEMEKYHHHVHLQLSLPIIVHIHDPATFSVGLPWDNEHKYRKGRFEMNIFQEKG